MNAGQQIPPFHPQLVQFKMLCQKDSQKSLCAQNFLYSLKALAYN